MADGKCTTCVLDRLQKFIDQEKKTTRSGEVRAAVAGMADFSPDRNDIKSVLNIDDTRTTQKSDSISPDKILVSISKEMVKWSAATTREIQSTNRILSSSTVDILKGIDVLASSVMQNQKNLSFTGPTAATTNSAQKPSDAADLTQIQSTLRPVSVDATANTSNGVAQRLSSVPQIDLIDQEEGANTLTSIQASVVDIQIGVEKLNAGINSLGKKFDSVHDVLNLREAEREAERNAPTAAQPGEQPQKDKTGGLIGALMGGIGGLVSGLSGSLKSIGGVASSLLASTGSLAEGLGRVVGSFVTMGGLATAGTLVAIAAGIGLIGWQIYEASKRIKETRELLEGVKRDEAAQRTQLDTAIEKTEGDITGDIISGKDQRVNERELAQQNIMRSRNLLREKEKELNNTVSQIGTVTDRRTGETYERNVDNNPRVMRLNKEIAELKQKIESLENKATELVPGNTFYTGNLEFPGLQNRLEVSKKDEIPYENTRANQEFNSYNFNTTMAPEKLNRTPILEPLDKNHEMRIVLALLSKPPIINLPAQNTNVVDQSSISYNTSVSPTRNTSNDIRTPRP